ncbi:MAG: outer membrane beta-barrel protein [Kofleriaceae bacterium]
MRSLWALCLVAVMPATIATANPITAGVHAGVVNSASNADNAGDADTSLGLFGRLGFSHRISGQLELSRINLDDDYGAQGKIRSVTALVVVELGSHKNFHWLLVAGAGLDHAETAYDSTSANHFEGGMGLEYQAPGGFTIGADLRIGGRSVDDDEVYYVDDAPALIYAPGIDEGEYRSARITAGIRF